MELNTDKAAEECKDFWSGLESYNTSYAAYCADPTLPPPSFLDLAFTSSSIFTAASLTSKLSATAIGGYLTDLVHHIGATEREIVMRYATKLSYYSDGADEAALEIQNCTDSSAEYVATITGKNRTV
jgi:hypothetical protein